MFPLMACLTQPRSQLLAVATASGPPAVDAPAALTPKRGNTNIVFDAEVAQSVEHSTENAGVVSSILTLGTSGLNFPRPHERA